MYIKDRNPFISPHSLPDFRGVHIEFLPQPAIMIKFIVFLVFVVVTTTTTIIHGRDIENPCGDKSLEQLINSTINASRLLSDECQSVMNAYYRENLLITVELVNLNRVGWHPIPVPNFHVNFSANEIINQQLHRDYHDISTFIVYLQFGVEQHLYRFETIMKTELEDVVDSFFDLLCLVRSMMIRRNMMIFINFVDSSIIPEDLKTLSTKHRLFRDYIVFRDASMYLDSAISYYEDLREHLSIMA